MEIAEGECCQMEKNNITKETLIENGYNKYDPNRKIDNERIVARYQKRFDDTYGKKYYIDIVEWNFPEVESDYYKFEFNVQFHKDDKPINIQLFGNEWTIKEAEDLIEDIWDEHDMDYYARWDEE